MLVKGPPLPDGTIHDVPLGSSATLQAGVYVNQDLTATFQLQGDDAGTFQIFEVETDDVVFIDDPDLHHRVKTLEFAAKVEGSGPIAVTADQAVIVKVAFACPANPGKDAFRATLVSSPGPGITIPILATANLGFLYGNVVSGPADMAPGETARFGIELFSSMGHPVAVRVAIDSGFGDEFSAPTSDPVTVPAAGGVANVSLAVTCKPNATLGQRQIGFGFVDENGNPVPRSTGFGTEVKVIGGTVLTTIDLGSVNMVKGGIVPMNLTIQSLRGGGTDVSYSLVGPPEFGLVGAPIHVNAGSFARGTVWLTASSDAPQDATLQLNQFSFGGTQGQLVPRTIFGGALPAPPGKDFVVLRIYWGPKWVAGNPFGWQQMEQAIFTIVRSPFVRGFVEYGVSSVRDVAVINTPGLPTVVPAFAVDPTSFPVDRNNFDDGDLTALIIRMIETGRLPRPDQLQGTPFYYVAPQQGSFYRPDPGQHINGAHGTFSFGGADHLYGWSFQGGDLPGTTPYFGHELAEALCRGVAGTEIGDPCESLFGTSAGLRLQPYLSLQRDQCVLPDMANDPSVAATSPPAPP